MRGTRAIPRVIGQRLKSSFVTPSERGFAGCKQSGYPSGKVSATTSANTAIAGVEFFWTLD